MSEVIQRYPVHDLVSAENYKTSHFAHLYSLFPAEPHPLPYIKAATAILYSNALYPINVNGMDFLDPTHAIYLPLACTSYNN